MNEGARQQITIQVIFFGAARDAVGTNPLTISVESPATVASAFEILAGQFPDLKRFGRSLLFAVNQEYASANQTLRQNDELAVFPPVCGGATGNAVTSSRHDFFEITTAPIDVGAITRRVVLP